MSAERAADTAQTAHVICDDCGEAWYTHITMHQCAEKRNPKLIQAGWLCPRCDIIIAPMYRRCEWCGPEEQAK